MTNKRTGKPFIMQSKSAKSQENMIRQICSYAYAGQPSDKAIIFHAVAVFRIPKSGKNKNKKVGQWCDLMPDSANIESLLHDALESVIYVDDRQIVFSTIQKTWGKRRCN